MSRNQERKLWCSARSELVCRAVTSAVSACGDWIRCLTYSCETELSQMVLILGLACGALITHTVTAQRRPLWHTHTHKKKNVAHFTSYQSVSSKCPMKCNVVEPIQELSIGWLTSGWDAKNTAFILGERMILMRHPLLLSPPHLTPHLWLIPSPSTCSGLCGPSVRQPRRVCARGVRVLCRLDRSELWWPTASLPGAVLRTWHLSPRVRHLCLPAQLDRARLLHR